MFPSLRVDVLDPVSILPVHVEGDGVAAEKVQQQETVVVYLTHPSNKWDHLGAKIATSSAPLSSDAEVKLAVSALGKREFLEKRQGFDILSFFKNPMILMGVLSMGLVFGMPYLMDNSEFYDLLPPIPSPLGKQFTDISCLLISQWMKKQKPNSQKCKNKVPSEVQVDRPVPHKPFKTSISPVGWLERVILVLRRNSCEEIGMEVEKWGMKFILCTRII